jgi:hypothetical protein
MICAKPFHRGKEEARATFEKRPTCSRQCATVKRSRDAEAERLNNLKTCENPDCGKEFFRRTKGETKDKFRKRKTCGEPCGHALRRSAQGHEWGEQKKRRPSDSVFPVTERKLPPVTSVPTPIPEPPKPTMVKVWRPESWGGSYMIEAR